MKEFYRIHGDFIVIPALARPVEHAPGAIRVPQGDNRVDTSPELGNPPTYPDDREGINPGVINFRMPPEPPEPPKILVRI